MFLYYTILIQFSSPFGNFFHLFMMFSISSGGYPQLTQGLLNLVNLQYSLKLLRVYSKKQQNRYKLSILLTFPL